MCQYPKNNTLLACTKRTFKRYHEKLDLFLFPHLLTNTNPFILLNAILQTLFLCLYLCVFQTFYTNKKFWHKVSGPSLLRFIMIIKVKFINIYPKIPISAAKTVTLLKLSSKKGIIISQ